jgi:hypothetical protein
MEIIPILPYAFVTGKILSSSPQTKKEPEEESHSNSDSGSSKKSSNNEVNTNTDQTPSNTKAQSS